MKQRIFTIMLVAATIVVTGCSKSSITTPIAPPTSDGYEPSTHPISFLGEEIVAADEQSSTKASLQGDFVANDKIGVIAYYLQDGSDIASTIPNFMYNQEVKFDGANWSYSPIKYWPNNSDDQLAFFAYVPYSTPDNPLTNCVSISSSSKKGDPILTYTPNMVGELNTDLCCADPVFKRRDYTDADNNLVDLTFRHKLAKITFAVSHNGVGYKDDGNARGDKVRINYISIRDIKGGEYNMHDETWKETTPIESMRISAEAGGINNNVIIKYPEAAAGTVREFFDVSTEDTAYFIPPQTIASDGGNMIISVNLELTKSYAGYTDAADDPNSEDLIQITATVELEADDEVKVEAGKAYKFNIELDVKNFVSIKIVNVTEEDWVEKRIDLGEIE